MVLVSYAQNNEDVLLNRVFGGQQTGFYVDVGAYDPVDGSVTKLFYDRGWSGINVEPGSIFDRLAAQRPRDVNLRIAVLDRKGEIEFFEDSADRGMSRVAGGPGSVSVPCDTLEGVIAEHGRGRPIDFIKIDAEGAEAAIVNSTDWRALRPRVLVIEATLPWSSTLANADWEPTLLGAGYVKAYFDGINCYYVPEEEWPILSRHFQAPVNVLDNPVQHGTVRALSDARDDVARIQSDARDDVARIQSERDQAATALRAAEARLGDVTAMLEESRSQLAAAQAAAVQWQEAHAEAVKDLAAAVANRDAAVSAHALAIQERQAALSERDAAARERDELMRARDVAEPAGATVTPDPPATRRGPLRRLARFSYRLVRPIVRPIAWRVRGFMTGPALSEVAAMRDSVRSLEARFDSLDCAGAASQPAAAVLHASPDIGAADELRRLARAMEDAMLALAVANAGPRAPAEDDASLRHVALRLPAGRLVDLAVSADDLSVGAALAAADGEWEPHVRRYLEATVKHDWACLDIGANVGVHTLSLAVLATGGRVLAFEADPLNHALLKRNIAMLDRPRAQIEALNLALWDAPGFLTVGGAEELAGCSFVAAGPMDAAMTEERLRTVVSADAIAGTGLRTRQSRVEAVRLDDWARARNLARLDFIKLDVEGAEANVIRGAEETIRRLRPILLVEYNPACAEAYFGEPADALFHEISRRFALISAVESDGRLTPLADWAALQERLSNGKGWEDLVCLPA